MFKKSCLGKSLIELQIVQARNNEDITEERWWERKEEGIW